MAWCCNQTLWSTVSADRVPTQASPPPLSLTFLSIFLPLYLSLPSLTFSPSISPSATLFLWFSLSPSLSPSLSTSLSPSISPPFLPFTFRREIIRAHFARGFLSFTLNKFKQHFQELRLILFLIADHQSSCSTQQSMERCTSKAHLWESPSSSSPYGAGYNHHTNSSIRGTRGFKVLFNLIS